MKGFGRSGHPAATAPVGNGDYSSQALADGVLALLELLDYTDIRLFAHSWGALAGDLLVSQHQDLFASYVRSGTPVNFVGPIEVYNSHFIYFQNPSICKSFYDRPSGGFIKLLYGYDGVTGWNTFSAVPNSVIDVEIAEYAADPLTPDCACKYYSDLPELAMMDYWMITMPAVLSTIDIPVLVLAGDKSIVFPLSWFDNMHEALPQAELGVVSNAGHFPMHEQPLQTLLLIKDFMARFEAEHED